MELTNPKDVDSLIGIGKKTKDKIKEIIKTGKLNKVEELNKSEIRVVCGRLCEVWGIGPQKAFELYRLGIRTVDELKKS
jgi:DNA polymerase/3'-5' exonuclease PolX